MGANEPSMVTLAALSARTAEYDVFVIFEACGANGERAEQAAIARLADAGVMLTSMGAVLANGNATSMPSMAPKHCALWARKARTGRAQADRYHSTTVEASIVR